MDGENTRKIIEIEDLLDYHARLMIYNCIEEYGRTAFAYLNGRVNTVVNCPYIQFIPVTGGDDKALGKSSPFAITVYSGTILEEAIDVANRYCRTLGFTEEDEYNAFCALLNVCYYITAYVIIHELTHYNQMYEYSLPYSIEPAVRDRDESRCYAYSVDWFDAYFDEIQAVLGVVFYVITELGVTMNTGTNNGPTNYMMATPESFLFWWVAYLARTSDIADKADEVYTAIVTSIDLRIIINNDIDYTIKSDRFIDRNAINGIVTVVANRFNFVLDESVYNSTIVIETINNNIHGSVILRITLDNMIEYPIVTNDEYFEH